MHSDQHRCSFGAQLLKDRMCGLRNSQANPQLVQGSRPDLTADQGAGSTFLGSSIPITLMAAQTRFSGSFLELSVYFLNPQACLLKNIPPPFP